MVDFNVPVPPGPTAPKPDARTASPVLWARSLLFNVLFFGWTGLLFGLVLWWLLPLRPAWMEGAIRFWSRSVLALARVCVGLSFEIKGTEHLPDGPCIVACNHQSAWDTFIFFEIFERPVYIVKQTLMDSPFYGWYAHKTGMIPAYDGGSTAIQRLLGQVRAALGEGRSVVIFPEGERVRSGSHVPLKPGVAVIAARVAVPVVPAVLNSGLFWGKRSFLKRPGVITLEFLPPIPPGLKRADLLRTLAARLEQGADRLERDYLGHAVGREKP